MTDVTWKPRVTLDLMSTSVPALRAAVEQLRLSVVNDGAPEPVDLASGWHMVLPEQAEAMLCRTAGNRKVSLQTIQYYGRKMVAGTWRRTGQTIILDKNGKLLDGQHRCWAGYLTGVPFPIYIVADGVDESDDIFTDIDDGRPRSAGDALKTAGHNGLSSVISQAVRIAELYDANAMNVNTVKRLPRSSPARILAYVQAHPLFQHAAHVQIAEHQDATNLIADRDVAVFAAYKIVELFGDDTLDDFMTALGATEPPAQLDSPILALRKKLIARNGSDKPMNKHQALAHIIKAFNAWTADLPLKNVTVKVDEKMPQFAGPDDEDTTTAEAA